MTRRGMIGTSSPVFGLRPSRWPLSGPQKLPNDEIFTASPRARALEISLRTNSNKSAELVARQAHLLIDGLAQLCAGYGSLCHAAHPQ